ncbi:MAG: sigma-70 family RNA polymerase sigma factor [Treponema sp.]|nr:sigma-70 family RNA polymerase sigma factor [Treponema sp.]
MAEITQVEDLPDRLLAAKTDKRALNTLLQNYMPFIKKCVSSVFFKGQTRADNLTDAMLAFAHSVKTYDPEQGAFLQYAATVIRNRLIDSARKELLFQKRFFSLKKDDKDNQTEIDISMRNHIRIEEEKSLSLEIEEVNLEFAKWGFSWASLLKNCPKQERSRKIAQRISQTILSDSSMLAETLSTRKLPISRLAETFPAKAPEKYRQYIAALIILSRGDYPYVYSFVPQPFSEEEDT